MSKHALLSPSSAYRWLICTPSARLAELMPEPRRKGGFDHAMNGTTAHAYAEAQLRRHYKQITAAEYVKAVEEIKSTEYYCDEFEEYVAQYVLYVRSQIGEHDEPHFEVRTDYSEWVANGSGTSDVVIIRDDTIVIIDAKFGVMHVDAKENAQMRLYALGSYIKFKEQYPNIKKVICTIMQPRIGNVSTEELTLSELLKWAEVVVRPAAKLADKGEGPFVAGDHCHFCKAKATCRARSEFSAISAADDFRQPKLLTDAELLEAFSKAAQMKKWLADVEAFILDRATEDGVVPEGYTLGKSKTNRKISDEIAAAEKLLAAGFPEDGVYSSRALKSIAQLEKMDKDKVQSVLGDLIVRPEGEPKLVPVKGDAKDDFS